MAHQDYVTAQDTLIDLVIFCANLIFNGEILFMDRILITGGNGFLGSTLIGQLLDLYPNANIEIIDINQNTYPNPKVKQHQDVTLESDQETLLNILHNVDCVFHLAGLVSFAQKDKEKLFHINTHLLRRLFNLADKANVKKFIHISSVAALGYNDSAHNPADTTLKFDWRKAHHYKKFYMLSKHKADQHILDYEGNMQWFIAHPGLMLGKQDRINTPKFQKLSSKPFAIVPPGGTNVIEVKDVARGLLAIYEHGKNGEQYILGNENLTYRQIIQRISNQLGKKTFIFELPKWVGNVMFHCLNILEKLTRLPLTADNIHSAFLYRYFNNQQTCKKLHWRPVNSIEKAFLAENSKG